MVVIRAGLDQIKDLFDKDFTEKVSKFSEIIGYTIERDGNDLKIEFNPDRPDLFSFTTLNAAVLTFFNGAENPRLKSGTGDIKFIVTEDGIKLRPYVTSFVCRGNQIGKRLRDMIDFQERIHQTIGKDRSKVSIGIHDLEGLQPPFTYISRQKNAVRFVPYDGDKEMTAEEILKHHEKGKQYSHLLTNESVPIIVDSRGQVLSMPPIVNGIASLVKESTINFFIDITGTDLRSVVGASLLLRYFFASAGFRIEETSQIGGIPSREILVKDGRIIKVRNSEIRKILGANEIGMTDVHDSLRKMGYSVKSGDANEKSEFQVEVLGSRLDVMGEVDIIEDIGKAVGYDSIPVARPNLDLVGSLRSDTHLKERIREVSVGLGFQEVMTFVVTASKFSGGIQGEVGATIMNPKSQDFNVIRDRLRLNLLDLLRINKRRNLPQRIFEVGEVVVDLDQRTNLCYAISDSRVGFSNIKQYLQALLQRFGKSEPVFVPYTGPEFIPGRAGRILINGTDYGVIGEVHPEILVKFDLANPVALFEIGITALL